MRTIQWVFMVLILVSGSVMASGSRLYLGAQYGYGQFIAKDIPAFENRFGGIIIGGELQNGWAIESRYNVEVTPGSVEQKVPFLGALKANVSVDHVMSLFLKRRIMLTRWLGMYGLVGGSSAKASVQLLGVSLLSYDDRGFSYGGGMDLFLDQTTRLNVEYVMYIKTTAYEYAAVSAGLRFLF